MKPVFEIIQHEILQVVMEDNQKGDSNLNASDSNDHSIHSTSSTAILQCFQRKRIIQVCIYWRWHCQWAQVGCQCAMDPHHAEASIEFWYLKSPSTLSTPLICFKLLRHRRHSVRSTVYVGELFQSLSLTRRDQNIQAITLAKVWKVWRGQKHGHQQYDCKLNILDGSARPECCQRM